MKIAKKTEFQISLVALIIDLERSLEKIRKNKEYIKIKSQQTW